VGTSFREKCPGLVQLDVRDGSETASLLDNIMPSVVLWALQDGNHESDLIARGLVSLLSRLPTSTRFIFMSSDAVFGAGTGPYDEDDPPSPHAPNSPVAQYAAAKTRGELLVRQWGGSSTIVRVGPLYGPSRGGAWDRRTTAVTQSLAAGQRLGRAPNLVKSFARVDGVARLLLHLTSDPVDGVLHVATAPRSFYEVALAIVDAGAFDPLLVHPEPVDDLSPIPLNTSLTTRRPDLMIDVRQDLDFAGLSSRV
jgi:nucleoside-diphosphate-sugar epimerase